VEKEQNILQRVRLKASELGAILWRNNCGAYKSESGHYIKYGVASPGGSDLLGMIPMVVTQDMVGKMIAIFTAFEIKKEGGRITPEQQLFINIVEKNGGIAAIIRSAEDVEGVICNAIRKKMP